MKSIEILPWIYLFDSWKTWKTTTIMAGVHGNERSGIIILEELLNTLEVFHWKIYLITQANPRAIEQNVRQTEKNMNRAFHTIAQWATYEDTRAQELIPILRQSDILLDVHNTLNTENSVPFLISEHPEWNRYFPVDRIISGLDNLHPGGSDGYMNSIGKIGLCIESGSIYDPRGVKMARESIMNFLRATGNIEWIPQVRENQEKYNLDTIIKAKTTDFRFIKKWLDFEKIQSGELIGYDGDERILAPYDGVIVFSHETKNIGDEMCVFGKVG